MSTRPTARFVRLSNFQWGIEGKDLKRRQYVDVRKKDGTTVERRVCDIWSHDPKNGTTQARVYTTAGRCPGDPCLCDGMETWGPCIGGRMDDYYLDSELQSWGDQYD